MYSSQVFVESKGPAEAPVTNMYTACLGGAIYAHQLITLLDQQAAWTDFDFHCRPQSGTQDSWPDNYQDGFSAERYNFYTKP